MDLIRIGRRDILNYRRRRATERNSVLVPSTKLDELRARRQLSAPLAHAIQNLADVGNLIDMAPWLELWESPPSVA